MRGWLGAFAGLGRRRPRQGEPVPDDALLDSDGEPIRDSDGEIITAVEEDE